MESPESWNSLTATLAVSDLKNPPSTWAFMVVQGFVRDDAGDRELFYRILREEVERGEITGPSLPYRIAAALSIADIARPTGLIPDSWGTATLARLEVIAAWGALDGAPIESLRRWQRQCQQPGAMPDSLLVDSEVGDPRIERPGTKKWWKWR